MIEETILEQQSADAADHAPDSTEADNYGDPSIGFNAIQNAPDIPDDNYPRYAMSGLLPISLFRQHGNNSYADFTRKNAKGQATYNPNYYPPFTMMPLIGGEFNIPYEPKMMESDDPVEAAEFDYSAFMKQPKDGSTKAKRSPKQCADIFVRENYAASVAVFESLVGFRINDPDRGYLAAKTLIDAILPVRDTELFPVEVRVRNGVPFKGPFLDQILAFVKKHSYGRIAKLNLPDSDLAVAENLYTEIVALLQKSISAANTILNETEAEIRDPSGLKKSYDVPNLDIADAPVPTDLYCLAHTNRIELDEKQLRASEAIGGELAAPMTKLVETLVEKFDSRQQQAPASVPTNTLTPEAVDELLRKQREELMQEFEAKIAQAVAANAGATGGAKKK